MSSYNFRVSLNLSHFFKDHRRKALIFVKEDVKTVGDLQNRISSIFGISSLYLINSLDEYLPPCQDIRILETDNQLCVFPINNEDYREPLITNIQHSCIQPSQQLESTCANDTVESKNKPEKKRKQRDREAKEKSEEEIPFSKKKKIYTKTNAIEETVKQDIILPRISKKEKKKHVLDDVGTGVDKKESDLLVIKEKKKKRSNNSEYETKKKRYKKCLDDAELQILNKRNSSIDSLKKDIKKVVDIENYSEKCQNTQNVNMDQLIPVLQSHINSYNEKNGNITVNKMGDFDRGSEKEEKTRCKGDLVNYTKKSNLPTITEEYLKNKTVNLVRIDVVSSPKNKNPNFELNIIDSNNQNPIVQHQQYPVLPTMFDLPDQNCSTGSEPSTSKREVKSISKNITPIELHQREMELERDLKSLPNENDEEMTLKVLPQKHAKKNGRLFHTPEYWRKQFKSFDEKYAIPNKNNVKNKSEHIENVEETIKTGKDQHYVDSESNKSQEVNIIETKQKYKHDYSHLESPNLSQIIMNDLHKNMIETNINQDKNHLDDLGNLTPVFSTDHTIVNDSTPAVNWDSFSSIEQSSIEVREQTASDMSGLQWLSMESRLKKISGVAHILDALRNNQPFVSSDRTQVSISQSVVNDDTEAPEPQLINKSETDVVCNNKIEVSVSNSHCIDEASVSEWQSASENETKSLSESCKAKELWVTDRSKRKRRRKRKSKKPIAVDEFPPQPVDEIQKAVKPMNLKGNPSMHIKFVEDPEDSTIMVVDISNEQKNEPSEIQSITIESDTEDFIINEDNILRSPLMTDLLPKSGDIISFKVLKLGDNYNPEVSSYITGKVKAFNKEDKITIIKIIYGLKQLEEPIGKLSMVDEENGVSNVREFLWTDLLEPRLLFP